jgi:hypothetical protein
MSNEGEASILSRIATQLESMGHDIGDIKAWQRGHDQRHADVREQVEEQRLALETRLTKLQTTVEMPGNPIEAERRLGQLEGRIDRLKLRIDVALGIGVSAGLWVASQVAGHVTHVLGALQSIGTKAPGS